MSHLEYGRCWVLPQPPDIDRLIPARACDQPLGEDREVQTYGELCVVSVAGEEPRGGVRGGEVPEADRHVVRARTQHGLPAMRS